MARALDGAGNGPDKRTEPVRIAITTRQPGPGGPLDCATDSRFGRSDGFVVADTETGEARYVENAQGAAHARGAGILAGKGSAETIGIEAPEASRGLTFSTAVISHDLRPTADIASGDDS